MTNAKELCALASAHWAAGRADDAIGAALAAYRLAPNDTEAKVLLAGIVGAFPMRVGPEMRAEILQLVQDRDVAPQYISMAGWFALMREPSWAAAVLGAAFDSLAPQLEGDELALALLRETPVFLLDAELVLTQLRQWLLLSGQWLQFPRLVDALAAQAVLNGGAWPFSDAERELLKSTPTFSIVEAYLPARIDGSTTSADEFADPITRAVAEDYERWPYPVWKRIMATDTTRRLPDQIRCPCRSPPRSSPRP